MSQLELFEFAKPIPYEEIRTVYGGIYKDKGISNEQAEWRIAWGCDCVCVIFDGIGHIEEIVEHGGIHNMELVAGYALGIKVKEGIWQIRNSSRKYQSDYIIGQGTFVPGFYESLTRYRKIF